METEVGGDEIEVVDIVRREEDQEFRGVLGEDKVWVEDGVVPQEPSFELSLLEASSLNRLAGPESDVMAEYDAGVSEPPEARSLTEDLIELDTYGYSDHSIELSSDEEEAPGDGEVLLDVMKRPPVNTQEEQRPIECLEILDSDEEFPVCVISGEKNDNVNVEEKSGIVQEYIEIEGAGILLSPEFGLVLFHLDHVWYEGEKVSGGEARRLLPPGSRLKFYDQSFIGEEFKRVSSEGVFHQAIVCWYGLRPAHLLKMMSQLGEEYRASLEAERNSFMLYLRGEVFIRAALVKVKGTVVGYLTPEVGIIEVCDAKGETMKVVFHIDAVWIFKKPLLQYGAQSTSSLLPVGLNCSVDARQVSVTGVPQIDYQALVVLAGPWPSAPSPTLLPGGEGSYSPTYEVPSEGKHTFYYLELQLESRLSKQLYQLRDLVERAGGGLRYNWSEVREIRSPEDKDMWREQFTSRRVQHQRRFEGPRPRREPWVKRPVQTVFKAPPIRRFKTKEEIEDLESMTSSIIANRGTRCNSAASEYSGFSRPHSSLSQHSLKSQRSWYSNFPGALRIKTEVKQEPGGEDDDQVDGGGQSKRSRGESGESWRFKRVRGEV